jgi:light-regulated signal transduction histidine kinase (bacteriophytochrome)
MRNMGTGASMSVSIVVKGALWGLISAHNRVPRRVNPQVRSACDMLGQMLSLHVEARLQAAFTAERLALKQVETDLIARLAAVPSLQHGLADNAEAWMALTRAQGAAVVTQGGVSTVGSTPDAAAIRALALRLREDGHDLFATESMAETWPEAASFAEVASGLVAVSISRLHPDYILWFRPEVVRTIDWSGKPEKPAEPDSDRLHPRRSFALWREQVRRRALRWSAAEIESAEAFRGSIQNLVLRRAEERAELTDRLERSNRELEAFSYSISHDLRAPFRHIVGYAELLAERERGLEGTSRHYLQTIKEAANAAGRLVDDLLQFSHLGRTQLRVGPVDMNKLVAEVRRSLAPDMAGRTVTWRVDPLPDAWGDTSLLRQVLQNLLQNAVKYTGPRAVAEIAVSGEEAEGGTTYLVSDNGVGFEMQYVGKLFGVFQRLHRAEEFEGTGIGLALVKRIVERHGGTVAAEGTLGSGAKFRFTLPKRGEASGG